MFVQLILPECMKLLPVYLNCVLKSDVLLPGGDVSLDDRAYLRQLISCMDVTESHVFFYPRLLPLVRRSHIIPDVISVSACDVVGSGVTVKCVPGIFRWSTTHFVKRPRDW